MQKRRISADGLSNVLSVGAIGLFTAGHFLPVFIRTDRIGLPLPYGGTEISGGEIAAEVPRIFYRFGVLVWDNPIHALWPDALSEVLAVLFLPLIWTGVGGFFAARSYPRMAGLVAVLLGLCAATSLAGFWWSLTGEFVKVGWGSGFYVWFTSIGLLCAAGVCKHMPVRKQPAT
jgi:hypothetical protein